MGSYVLPLCVCVFGLMCARVHIHLRSCVHMWVCMCVWLHVCDSFQGSFSPYKIFILVVQGPVIAISHPELFIPRTDWQSFAIRPQMNQKAAISAANSTGLSHKYGSHVSLPGLS